MRLPLSWLDEYVRHGLAPEELADRLAATGTAVEAVETLRVPPDPDNLALFRVGRVREAERHPDADRLRVCRVDLGEEAPRTIVCGAPNVAAGQAVAVALPGARLPGREPLGVVRLRGVESRGMILSETELGLGGDGRGILELDPALEAGRPLAEVLPIAEAVLELDITSNRPDCLAVHGMAREVHAITGAPLVPLDLTEPPAEGRGQVGDHAWLRVEAPDLCPRYMARVFTEVRVGPSPAWLRARLEAAGMRAISNVVDVTNYVMLLTGQPLHAFDLDRMAGPGVVVRRAHPGEEVITLDGQRRVMDPSMLAICDAERPAVIAGIMGAEDVEVSAGTTRVLLEAATFDGPAVLTASLALGLRSESSGRFEKGLPVELPARAMTIASRMLVELCGARMVPGTLDSGPEPVAAPRVTMRHARAEALLGIPVPPAESAAILERLGFAVTPGAEALEVAVPPERRRDVGREADLVEEVGRIHGYDRIPAVLPRIVGRGRRTAAQALVLRLSRRAADLGLSEAVTYRFVPESDADRLRLAADDPRREVVRLAHPLSEEMAVMRRSMLPGLLRAAARNQRHQRPDGGLFEVGRTYAPRPDGTAEEREWFAALVFGAPARDHWRVPAAANDVWSAIGLAETLAAAARVRLRPEPNAAPYFHPVRQVRLLPPQAPDGGPPVAWAGEVHPLVLRGFDVTGPATAVVVDLAALLAAAPSEAVAFEDLLTVPVSTRDVAVVVHDTVRAADLVATARAAGGPLVREARVFDRYAGAQVGEGLVSVALRLTVADPARTLTDAEIAEVVERVRAALADRHGAAARA
ncbi:MAG TPA: phenylalanine--tRNA ligase subunit beta [Miltoncostaeaceae bacterium]|nr:phenylalanine--tRNA ligase subunit beta [Miltoncostaeaceae bacterium]